jgi:phage baseplate assembly protein W
MQIQQHSFLGSGWSFPVLFSTGNYQLHTTAGQENINEAIDLILMTKMGERCFDPRFGSGLQQFFFRTMDETLKGEIADAVSVSLLHNEPRITVKNIEISFTDQQAGLIEIQISYVCNRSNTRHNHVFPFHLKEGTNIGR